MKLDTLGLHRAWYSIATLSLALALLLFLLVCAACTHAATATTPTPTPTEQALPYLLQQLHLPTGAAKGVLAAQHQVYFLGDTGVARIDGVSRGAQVTLPNLNPPYGQFLDGIAISSQTGLVYVLDRSPSMIHVLSDTTLITTLTGITEQPLQALADEASGEMDVFYTSQKSGKPQPRVAILAGTQVVTDLLLPVCGPATLLANLLALARPLGE